MENQTANNVFFVKASEAIRSSFILFETKLEDMLYSLAQSPIIYDIVEKCLKDFNYGTFKNKCLIAPTASFKGYFAPPQDRRDFIALSFNILYEVFEKKMPFTDLLELYFDGEGCREKFENFKERLLMPLYNALYSVLEDLNAMYKQNSDIENQKDKEKIDNITSLKNYINEQKIKFEDKEYLIYFIDAIIKGESKEVCCKAINYILSNYKKGDEILKQILEVLF